MFHRFGHQASRSIFFTPSKWMSRVTMGHLVLSDEGGNPCVVGELGSRLPSILIGLKA